MGWPVELFPFVSLVNPARSWRQHAHGARAGGASKGRDDHLRFNIEVARGRARAVCNTIRTRRAASMVRLSPPIAARSSPAPPAAPDAVHRHLPVHEGTDEIHRRELLHVHNLPEHCHSRGLVWF